MDDKTHQARVAALSVMQLSSVVNLLRAHGETHHAEGVEAAKDAVIAIVGREVGAGTLAQAIQSVAEELRYDQREPALVPVQH